MFVIFHVPATRRTLFCVTEPVFKIQQVKINTLLCCAVISVLKIVSDILETEFDEGYNILVPVQQGVLEIQT